jgi:hypothetical protein
MDNSVPLSFMLLGQRAYPDPEAFIAHAAQLDVGMQHSANDQALTFDLAIGGSLIIMLIEAPHPDAAGMPPGPTAVKPELIAAHTAHLILTCTGLPPAIDPEILMAKITAAAIRVTPAIGAMLGGGVLFHNAELFAGMVEASGDEIPVTITVDITAARKSEERMSFLTHGLRKYGREEFYVTAAVTGQGALDYLMALTRWMVADRTKVLPTGDTVGRTPEEKILVQRVPSPIAGQPDVIRLDMDVPPAEPPRKKGLFRKK